MANSIGWNAWKLMEGAKRNRENLEKLEKECGNWATEQEEKELADLVGTVKEVEIDVSSMLVDSIFEGIELIRCKRQPGNLLISRHACHQRYLMSLEDGRNIPNDVFGMLRKTGLEICRNCPEGHISFKTSEKRTAPYSRKLKPAVRPGPVEALVSKSG